MNGPLILVAASGLAREAAAAAQAQDRPVLGCVDDDPTLWSAEVGAGLPVLGGIDEVVRYPGSPLVVCAGRGVVRAAIVARLAGLGVGPERYTRVVHPTVTVPGSATVGAGSILLAGTVLTADVSVGEHVVCMPHVTLTHDCRAEDYATLCAGVTLGGAVHVGRGAYLGMASSVRERVAVGAGAVLGMGAVLLRDLPAGEAWAGVPARPLEVGVR